MQTVFAKLGIENALNLHKSVVNRAAGSVRLPPLADEARLHAGAYSLVRLHHLNQIIETFNFEVGNQTAAAVGAAGNLDKARPLQLFNNFIDELLGKQFALADTLGCNLLPVGQRPEYPKRIIGFSCD